MTNEMRRVRRGALLLALAGLTTLAGCFKLGRTEPPQRHYVLGGEAGQDDRSAPPGLAGITVGMRRMRIASYLDPPFIVVRREPHEVGYSEFNRWGERLEVGINRAVAGYLSAHAPFGAVDVAPWPGRERYDFLVQLHVDRFEGVAPRDTTAAEGEVQMLVAWEIVRQQDGAVLRRGTTEHRAPGWRVGDYPALVRSLDAGLHVLARELAAGLAELAAGRAAAPAAAARP
jgi:uncharacterized lipoprotein YmbA